MQLEGALGNFLRSGVDVYYSQVPLDDNDLSMFELNEGVMMEK